MCIYHTLTGMGSKHMHTAIVYTWSHILCELWTKQELMLECIVQARETASEYTGRI